MIFYVYYDAYGHALKAIDERELEENYGGDVDLFLKQMCRLSKNSDTERATGHVGTLRFESEEELRDFLGSLGDEITGFYNCGGDSRPYNF